MSREPGTQRDFEAELRNALKRVDPPTGFANRVLARLSHEEVRSRVVSSENFFARLKRSFRTPVFQTAVAATLCFAVIIGTVEHRRHERQQGEAAKRQLMLAMRITGAKLQYAQQKVQQVGSHQHDSHPQSQE